MLGDTADQMKRNIKDLAAEQYDSPKEAGAQAFQTSDKNGNDSTERDSGAVLSNEEHSTQRDEVTLAPVEPHATGERVEHPPASNQENSNDAPAQKI